MAIATVVGLVYVASRSLMLFTASRTVVGLMSVIVKVTSAARSDASSCHNSCHVVGNSGSCLPVVTVLVGALSAVERCVFGV